MLLYGRNRDISINAILAEAQVYIYHVDMYIYNIYIPHNILWQSIYISQIIKHNR